MFRDLTILTNMVKVIKMTKMRIFSFAINIIAIALGSIVCLILSPAGGVLGAIGEDQGIAVFSLITLLLMAVLLASEVLSMFRISDSTYHTVLVSLFLLLYSAFSPDAGVFWKFAGLKIPPLWFNEAATEVIFLGASISAFHLMSYTYRPNGKRISIAPILVSGFFSAILYGILANWYLQYIAHFFFLAFSVGYMLYFQHKCYKANIDNLVFTAICAVFAGILGMHTTNVLFYCGFVSNVMGWSSGYLWFIMFCFLWVYVLFILRVDKTAVKAEEFRQQAELLKTNMLVKQFKPHFVSNALMIIKTSYHLNLDEGDRAIWLFSNYMRDTVGMLNEGLVPLEKELEFVMHYIDFCNVGRNDEFKLVFDIDYSDFSVPALSLQPYIENAVKYSQINLKEDGCITISSYADSDNVHLRITDNGMGFDTKNINKESTGIRNSSERFKILLDAETNVESSPDGTIISIKIPNRGGKRHEDHSS